MEDAVLIKIQAIPDGTTDTKERATLKKLNALQCNLQDKMDKLVLKTFVLYQQMLSPALHAEWDNIVQDYCHMTGWKFSDGKASLEEGGREWDTLQVCLRIYLLTVCKPDSAERHH